MTTIKPGDWEKVTTWVESLLGRPLPLIITIPLGILVFVALVLSITAVIALATAKIREMWEKLRPAAYGPDQRRKALARQQFARYLLEQISRRNLHENWRDEQYAELEAEVEAEGRRRSLIPIYRNRGRRREKSLAAALRRSNERLILVEGEPGSGKSVALRHVALELAERAVATRNLESRLPVYVNLKELKRPAAAPIDHNLIQAEVLNALLRVTNHFTDEFVEANFEDDLREGKWVFLFDSFDEIPDVLSAVEASDVIQSYSEAISDFLSVSNRCRGIIASRYYRGPKNQGWSTFRILPLSMKRQRELISKALLQQPKVARQIREELVLAGEDIRHLARNPMLLGLLCEHMRTGSPFPQNAYAVMARYLDHRLERDASRIRTRYGLDVSTVLEVAETAAFAMTADTALGLSPRLTDLKTAMREVRPLDDEIVAGGLGALIYIRLARASDEEMDSEREFTFAHRRFQEYYATRVLLSGKRRVPSRDLLTDSRWREAAVVLLQNEDRENIQPLLEEAEAQLTLAAAEADLLSPGEVAAERAGDTSSGRAWHWPPGVLHVMSILNAGTMHAADLAGEETRRLVGLFVIEASRRGDLLDAKLAIQAAGAAPEDVLAEVMQVALSARSPWLEDAVYWQAARLSKLDPDFERAIRTSLFRRAVSNALHSSAEETRAYIARLPRPRQLLQSLRLAQWAPRIDLLLFAAAAAVCASASAMGTVFALLMTGPVLLEKALRERRGVSEHLQAAVRSIVAFTLLMGRSEMPKVGPDPGRTLNIVNDIIEMMNELAGAAWSYPGFSLLILWWAVWLPSVQVCVQQGHALRIPLWPLAPLFGLAEGLAALRRAKPAAFLGALFVAAALGSIAAIAIYLPWLTVGLLVPLAGIAVIAFWHDTKRFILWLRDARLLSQVKPPDYADAQSFRALMGRLRTRRAGANLLERLLRTGLNGDPEQWSATVREMLRSDGKLNHLSRLGMAETPAHVPTESESPEIGTGKSAWRRFLESDGDDSRHLYVQRDLFFRVLERAATSVRKS